MAVHTLRYEQWVPAPLPAVWAFFSRAENLQRITPPSMKFRVTSGPMPGEVYAGQIITYTVAPVAGIPLFWMTEITAVNPLRFFVDEQRRGPYRLWHHQHHFTEKDGGVLMTDLVHYQLPLGLLGELARVLFVRKQLQAIFSYRRQQVEVHFGKEAAASSAGTFSG